MANKNWTIILKSGVKLQCSPEAGLQVATGLAKASIAADAVVRVAIMDGDERAAAIIVGGEIAAVYGDPSGMNAA